MLESTREIFMWIIWSYGRKSHCTADTDGLRITRCVQTYLVCWRCLLKRRWSLIWDPPVYPQPSDVTKDFWWPQKKKSEESRSEERGGQATTFATSSSPPEHLGGYAPQSKYMLVHYHAWLHGLAHSAGISGDKFGRTCFKKTRYFAPLRRSGRR